MWYVLWERMLRANAFGVDRTSFSGFGESVVTRVEVFVLREVAEFGGELAVEAIVSLLVEGERLRVKFSEKTCWVTNYLR
jgi:hypothetical protein